jgi:hypothetical protein
MIAGPGVPLETHFHSDRSVHLEHCDRKHRSCPLPLIACRAQGSAGPKATDLRNEASKRTKGNEGPLFSSSRWPACGSLRPARRARAAPRTAAPRPWQPRSPRTPRPLLRGLRSFVSGIRCLRRRSFRNPMHPTVTSSTRMSSLAYSSAHRRTRPVSVSSPMDRYSSRSLMESANVMRRSSFAASADTSARSRAYSSSASAR